MTGDERKPLNRRRFLSIFAGLTAAGAMPDPRPPENGAKVFSWSGNALGAQARMEIHHPDRQLARDAVAAVSDAAERLEGVFSLYRPSSQLSRLNRDGVLERPDHHMLRLLSECRQYHRLTGGAFDVSVQPLWQLGSDPARRAARNLVNFRRVSFNSACVRLHGRHMQLTFNGVAQGYITDRMVEILRSYGLHNVLVDFGEVRALGHNTMAGRPWKVALAPGDAATLPATRLMLSDRAIATSVPLTSTVTAPGRSPHLFDPFTGSCPSLYRTLSVIAADACEADALSTAFSVMPLDEIRQVLQRRRSLAVQLTDHRGRRIRLTAGNASGRHAAA
jgi:thiamine biosynthesis lipoprotein